MNLQERFDAKYIPEPNSGCWLWFGATQSSGRRKDAYGCMNIGPGKTAGAHRISWHLHRGEAPAGMHVLHKCDVGLCVNPDHLFLGTHSDNMRDAVQKGRKNMRAGSKHHRSPTSLLSADIVTEIRNTPTRTNASWAKELSVSPATISFIRHRKSWKHIP